MLQHAGRLRASGASQQQIEHACRDYNRTHIVPPLPEASVLDRARRYQDGGHNDGEAGTQGVQRDEQVESWVHELNSRYAWIETDLALYSREHNRLVNPAAFRLGNDNQIVIGPHGKGAKEGGAGSAWSKHPQRAQFKELVLRPGEPEVTHDGCLNEWRGFAVAVNAGHVLPFLWLLRRHSRGRAFLV